MTPFILEGSAERLYICKNNEGDTVCFPNVSTSIVDA
jgi:hypothetical protein